MALVPSAYPYMMAMYIDKSNTIGSPNSSTHGLIRAVLKTLLNFVGPEETSELDLYILPGFAFWRARARLRRRTGA